MLRKGLIDELIDLNEFGVNYDDLYNKLKPFKNKGSLVIFDDSMSDIRNGFEKIFTTLGHHVNATLVYVVQNLFYKHSAHRNISLNLQYIVLMRNRRDLSQIGHFSKQLCPTEPKFITSSYADATSRPYAHMLFDCSPDAPDELQCRTNIFPFIDGTDEEIYTVYIKRNTFIQ